MPGRPRYSGPMTTVQALVLGVFQGVAEFLPVSSSGHLLILKELFGLSGVPRLFEVLLHLATLLSVLVVFRRRVAGIFGALYRFLTGRFAGRSDAERSRSDAERSRSDAENLALIVPALVATAVTALLGLTIERYFAVESPRLVSGLFLATAGLLLASTRFRGSRSYRELGLGRSALIGLAQGIGVFPGISRSGITIASGLAVGLDRDTAGEYAFLLAIPAILGAFLLEMRDVAELGLTVGIVPLAIGFVAAFATGVAALSILMPLVRGGKLAWFAIYLIPVGLLGLFLFR